MTARPRRRRTAPASGSGAFPEVEIPERVLAEARRASADVEAFAGVDLIEDYLREIHGPMPDHRADRDRWLSWVGAVEERPLAFLEQGLLS